MKLSGKRPINSCTLIDVGRGKLTPEDVRKIIESKNRCNAGTSVPAQALFLCHIEYPE